MTEAIPTEPRLG